VAKSVCPGCRRPINLDLYIELGEWVTCPRCQADLVVISLKPPALDWVDEAFGYARPGRDRRSDDKRSRRERQQRKQADVWSSDDW
jgi:lysine biosynthesis protein LysW